MTRWTDALKKWNAEHNPGKWCVPRKGSDGHAQVVKLMGPAPPKKGKAAKPDAVDKADMAAHAAKAAPPPAPAGKGMDIRSFLAAKAKAKESSKPDHPEKAAPPEPAGKHFKIKPKVKKAVDAVVEAPKSHRDKIIEMLSTELVKKR